MNIKFRVKKLLAVFLSLALLIVCQPTENSVHAAKEEIISPRESVNTGITEPLGKKM